MGRLIDADEYKKWLIDNYVLCDNGKILNDLDRQPTVDAVPVVRCKECDHASWRDIDGGVWKCKMAMGDEYHNDDFYCAWGERGEYGLDSDSTLGNP